MKTNQLRKNCEQLSKIIPAWEIIFDRLEIEEKKFVGDYILYKRKCWRSEGVFLVASVWDRSFKKCFWQTPVYEVDG